MSPNSTDWDSGCKIANDILFSNESGKVTALPLLDPSAALDIIDQTILLSRINMCITVCLTFFRSYLTRRSQGISCAGDISSSRPCDQRGGPSGIGSGAPSFLRFTHDLMS